MSSRSSSNTRPTLPQVWVDNHECDPVGGIYDSTVSIPGNYAATAAGLNQALNDWAAAPDQSRHVVIDAGTVISGVSNGGTGLIQVPVKLGAKKCVVVDSSTPLPAGRTVCSNGIQDAGLTPPLPDGGVRNYGCVSPNDTSSMYVLEQTGRNPVIDFPSNSNHVLFQNVEIRESSSYSSENTYLISMGHNDTTQLLASQAPAHIGIDRAYIHGYDSPETHIRNAINWSCQYCWITNSYIDQIRDRIYSSESHVLAESNAVGPIKIVHNWIEGGSSGIFMGGSVPSIGTYATDIEIRRNRVTLDLSYCPSKGASGNSIKNRIEIKEGARIVIDGNTFENNCVDAQAGHIYILNVRSCSSGLACDNYNATVADVTNSNNIVRHSAAGIDVDGDSGGPSAGISVGVGGQRWSFGNNLIYDIGNVALYGNALTTFGIREGSAGAIWTNCTVTGDGAVATLVCLDGGTGRNQTNIVPGDPVAVTACSNPAFNTPVGALGPRAMLGTTGLTVTYGSTITGTATGCSLTNLQGWPKWFTYSHNTYVTDQQSASPSNNGCQPTSSTWKNSYSIGNTYVDSLFLAQSSPNGYGWFCSAHSEGTTSESAGWDSTTLTAHHLVFPGRTAKYYTEYGGSNNLASPPVTLWFPSKVECSANTVAASSPTCVGVSGLMNGATMNGNLSDYHEYGLDPSSPYRAGGANQASDGKDMGASLPALDAAMSRTLYVCALPCGGGPFPDMPNRR